MAADSLELLLAPYRVLDLTDERGLLCGKTLADLGADVIQIEPPGGSNARNLGPFYHNQVHPEKSLFWWGYTANKRSITLNITTADGRDLLKRLVREAHFLIESFDPGHMAELGLGYEALEAINPGLVMVSITPFGQTGPYAHYEATDIVGMAMGGFMYLTGDSDRPPVRISFPQFYLHGGAAGALGAMLAHTHRALHGEGQHVDVSCQQAVAKTLAHAPQFWDLERLVLQRMGVYRASTGGSRVRVNWPCKDGYINYMPQGGTPGGSRSTRALLGWVEEEGIDVEEIKQVEWERLSYAYVPPEVMTKMSVCLESFFGARTKAELVKESEKRRIILFPLNNYREIFEHPHLEARGYFTELPHPELGASITYPGHFIKDQDHGDMVGLRTRPPLIGEHNREIYQEELGLTPEQLTALASRGVV